MGAFARGFILGAVGGVTAVIGAAMVSVIREDMELKKCMFMETENELRASDSDEEEEQDEEQEAQGESEQ